MDRDTIKDRITDIGMAILYLGLVVGVSNDLGITLISGPAGALAHQLGLTTLTAKSMPSAWALTQALFALGGAVLIIPPVMDRIELLIVNQCFLLLSALLYFVNVAEWKMLVFRLACSVAVFTYFKRRGLLGNFVLGDLLSLRFYQEAYQGKRGLNSCGAVGVDALGLGYCTGQPILYVAGSAFLRQYSALGFANSRAQIFAKWERLNTAYLAASLVFLLVQIHSLLV